MDGHAVSFGPFRLVAAQRLLLEGDKPVRLGSRAFDILTALVERAGEVIGKDELIARAWPQTFVEEANLKIQVSALRRALGDGQGGHRFVLTVPGRGYNFVAPIALEQAPQGALPPTTAPAPTATHNLPHAITRMIGRENAVAAIMSRLSRERLVTVVGAGGIGKTTLALAIAERLIPAYEHGLWLVDLAPLGQPRLVASTVAAVLGLEIHAEDPLPALSAALRDRRMLLLLDNCEHVIEQAAGLAQALLGGARDVSILATSREPLRVAGEREYRLGPLSSPQPSSTLTAAEAEIFPAVQLFVERASAIVEDFALSDAKAPLVGEICRRLDGSPLAIEFAASRVEVLGVEGLAAHLDDNLPGLGAWRRTALPRHRTMRAVLDWSYGLLTEDEQALFRSLGIFAGGFTVEAAAAVVIEPATTPRDAIDRLADLVAKSLIVADVSGANPRFRLLDTTRAYAIEKLDGSGEREGLARRHVDYYCKLFERAEDEAATRPRAEWLADYAREIDNLRGALNWAFSPSGDAAIGLALTVASGLLWTRLSLSDECRRLTERALSALGPGSDLATRGQIQLLALHGWSLEQTIGATPEMRAAFSKILELSQSMNDMQFKSLANWGLWVYHFNNGEFTTALDIAQRSIAEEGVDTIHLLAGDRIIGLSLHYLGEQSRSRRQIESLLRHPVDPLHQPDGVRSAFDHRVTLRSFLARILWLQGLPDQAMRMAKENVEDALALNHALSLANALVQAACPVAFFIGDLVAAEHFVGMLLDHSTKHALVPWQAWGRCFEGVLLIKRGDTVTGLQRLSTAVCGLRDIGYAVYYVAFMGELAEALGRARQAAHGLATIDEALARSERSEERWCVAELLRIKGELVVLQGASGAKRAAEEHFRQSLDWSRQQQVLSWELRTTTSFARLLRDQRRIGEARTLLESVYSRFSEGFETADLRTAKQLLDELA